LPGIVTGNATFQQTVPDWEEWGAGYLSACRVVARLEQQIVGWTLVLRRRAYRGVAEVSIDLTESASGCGIGGRRE